MSSKEDRQAEEERIRTLVRALPDEKRADFFRRSEKKLKDPDTYATLNFIFMAGLHHFYLGRWARGLLNIVVFWMGIALLFTEHFLVGIAVILLITLAECVELFRAQGIVQAYNNEQMNRIYNELSH
ncbi:membrane protein [Saccharospirillum impatiens]|uniref:membrane protein n=1 Tax=Saccharospirillum impatiens TaxID=169438 RepID=UPI0003FB5C83|nr:membrane protein [Saccharospirillum impatiens]